MQLAQKTIHAIHPQADLDIPEAQLFELPEKVLQFGTGVLLRALPDYFIDKANKKGLFNGRIVMVKSTDSDSTAFQRQDGLYTVCIRGLENGQVVEANSINASVSRVLDARREWDQVLECARNPEIRVVISNTTEVGIQLIQEKISEGVPQSFPGKLLACLLERYQALGGLPERGLIIIPTELISGNATRLKEILLELAEYNQLGSGFIEWLDTQHRFCNSLVDRIVPGKPVSSELNKTEEQLGYTDELLTKCEVFRLWAIEGDDTVRKLLTFALADKGVVIVPDISVFKELKLRLLNGTHTFCCGLAFLSGFAITRDAVNDPVFGRFTRTLMLDEIAASIPLAISRDEKQAYAEQVLERFKNPYIDHQWLSITLQYSSKMKMRNIPLLLQYYALHQKVPAYMTAGFAAYLLFMKAVRKDGSRFFGIQDGMEYEIRDDAAAFYSERWATGTPDQVVDAALAHTDFWGTDLTELPGFSDAVKASLAAFLEEGVYRSLTKLVQ